MNDHGQVCQLTLWGCHRKLNTVEMNQQEEQVMSRELRMPTAEFTE